MSRQTGPKRVEDRMAAIEAVLGQKRRRSGVCETMSSPKSMARVRAKLDAIQTQPVITVDAQLADFERRVRLMRRLGVAMWKQEGFEIALGPPPAETKEVMLDPVQRAERQLERDRRNKEIMFAASSVRPTTPEARDFSHVAPRGVTPSERDDGTPTQQ
jgi:hypothetical protein